MKTAKKNSIRSAVTGVSHMNRAARKAVSLSRAQQCNGCDTGVADGKSGLCPGCQAYREHQQ